ncbi:MAG: hypothetical protein K2X34_12250 [Hyphomonadaceae bacterium]|nr:hypothetical protein [Hyphomonadaceae bacterium]
MKATILIATALFVIACASAAPAPQQPGSGGEPSYADARSTASDEDVRAARRAYRAACQQQHPDGYCECMTGGMAQALAPADLAVATAVLSGQNVAASGETRARVEAVRADVDRGCAQFR